MDLLHARTSAPGTQTADTLVRSFCCERLCFAVPFFLWNIYTAWTDWCTCTCTHHGPHYYSTVCCLHFYRFIVSRFFFFFLCDFCSPLFSVHCACAHHASSYAAMYYTRGLDDQTLILPEPPALRYVTAHLLLSFHWNMLRNLGSSPLCNFCCTSFCALSCALRLPQTYLVSILSDDTASFRSGFCCFLCDFNFYTHLQFT